MKFDKHKLMRNISELIRIRNKKIGDVEIEVGVSKGYISRISKEDNDTIPTIDFISSMAEILDVSIDMLVNGDFERSNDNLFFVINFIDNLIDQTNLHNLEWMRETPFEENGERRESKIYEFETVTDEHGKKVDAYRYVSKFMPDKHSILLDGISYFAFSEELGEMFLMKLKVNENGVANRFFEFVSVSASDGELVPIFTTYGDAGALHSTVLDLYNCINRHERDLKISWKARDLMQNFMNNHNDDLPFK